MPIKCFLLFITLFFVNSRAHAWGLKQLGEEAASPYTTNARYPLYGGAFVTITLAIFEEQIVDPFQDKQVRNNTLDDSSKFGNWLGQLIPNALYIGGMEIASHYGDTKAHDRAIGMFKATAYASSVTTILKYTIREPRPNDNSTKNAFPSGHTTTSFAFSGYVAAEHGWGWGSASLLLSTFVAYSRINDNMHRLQDVTSGATIGWVYGWGMAKLQKQKKDNENEAFIAPILDSQTAGLSLYTQF